MHLIDAFAQHYQRSISRMCGFNDGVVMDWLLPETPNFAREKNTCARDN